MHTEYTPEEVRTLLAEDLPLQYGSATDADVLAAADVLEGVEELVCKLDPEVRRHELLISGRPVAGHFYVPVIDNCSRGAGVAIDPDGATSFMVTGHEFGDGFPTYFSARQAVAHALLREPEASPETPAELPAEPSAADGEAIVAALKANGHAVAAGRTLADVDPEVLAALYPLSEAGVAHLFAEDGGIVLATAGSTAGDRTRAVEGLSALPERSYSSRRAPVLFDGGEAGSHYSEESWFGHSVVAAPQSKEAELVATTERFKAARFVRPSKERPLDVAAIRRRVRRRPLVRAAVRFALAVDVSDAGETHRRLVTLVLVGRNFSRMMVRRALAAERPWDSKAERGRLELVGTRLRGEIIAGSKTRGGRPVEVTPATTLDADRRLARGDEKQAAWLDDPKLRHSMERRRKSGRAAYDTARALYLQRCPELEHKLLHILRRDGVQPEREFVSRRRDLAGDVNSPEAAVRAALRALAGAGKARRVRSQRTGEVFVAATEPLDETGHRRSLNGLIRDRSYGIVNPWADTVAVETDGDADEWQRGAEDLEGGELERLAPRRLRDTALYEQSLPADDLVAEPAAMEEIDAIA
jgi:hypothetical protein